MEMVLSNNFAMLNETEMLMVDGGDVSLAGIACSACGIIGGAATIVGGVASLAVPEPTGVTKVVGVSAIVAGASAVAGGCAGIAWACGY